jgi:hypothetical protein
MQSGAQANGLEKSAHERLRGRRVATRSQESVASVHPHPRQASVQAPPNRAAGLADITVPHRGILINVPAIRK